MSMEINDKFGIRYKVYKVNKNNFLMFPTELVKGYEDELGFRTSTKIIPCLSKSEDLKNRFLVDKIYDKEELESIYKFDEDIDFLSTYFYDDFKDIVVLVNTENDHINRVDFDVRALGDVYSDVIYCMDNDNPVAILNEKALIELMDCENKEQLKLVLMKYKDLIRNFKDLNKTKKVTKISVSNGKVNNIEVLKKVNNPDRELEIIINEELEKMDDEPVDENGVSYNGLRKYMKERVFGHDEEIDTLAQKIYMNYTAEDDEPVESILLVGPTGTGKTETVHAACKYLDLPSYEVNASNLVPQGIRGMSIEDVIIGLYESAKGKVKKAEKGIVFLDEFDKLNDTDLEVKQPVKNILLTFTGGGNFPIDNERYKFDFNSSRTTKIYAGVFERISEKVKSLGFNSISELNAVLGTDEEIRKKIIEKKYFTQEELTRISTILGYNELDRETKKQILTSSKLSEFSKKKARYKRQFKIDLIADESYIDAILDTIDADCNGMRNVNNYVKRTIDPIEQKILEGEIGKNKQLIITKDTVDDPNKFEVR